MTYKTLQDRYSRNNKYNFPKIIHQKYIIYVDLYIYRKKIITFVMQNLHLPQLMCQSAINVQCYSPHSPGECDLTPRKLIRVTMVTIPFCRLLLPPKVLAAMSPIYILLFLLVVTMTWGENTASVKFSGDIRIIIPVRTV